MGDGTPIAATFIGGVVACGLVAIIGGFLHYRRERILTHQERMKALELGHPLPDDAATARLKAVLGKTSQGEEPEGIAEKCFSTALWSVFWGSMCAGGAAASGTWVVPFVIAASAGAVGVTACIAGVVLASQARKEASAAHVETSKPRIDADAFDVVSRRG